ncbi:MAG TPA: hypothetical protein VGG10_16105 [Rhizomicrobium sp.]|jgi:hypothetical protein
MSAPSDTDLDLLLSMPLEEMADFGFSARVAAEVGEIRLARARRETVLALVAVVLLSFVMAASPAGHAVSRVAEVVASTPAVWLGLLMTALSSAVYVRVRS